MDSIDWDHEPEDDDTRYDIYPTRVEDMPILLDDMYAIAWIETIGGKRVKSVESQEDPLCTYVVTLLNGKTIIMDHCDELIVAWER